MSYTFKQLTSSDSLAFHNLMTLFGEVFNQKEDYQEKRPGEKYTQDFLNNPSHIVLVALEDEKVVGGLVGYELQKFEQERSEMYVYDLAVSNDHHRQGIGTSLIEDLKLIAQERGVYTIFLQADQDDREAVAFYQSIGMFQENTYNFEIKLK